MDLKYEALKKSGSVGSISEFSDEKLNHIKKLLKGLCSELDLDDKEIVYIFHEEYEDWSRLLKNIKKIKNRTGYRVSGNKASELIMLVIKLCKMYDITLADQSLLDVMFGLFKTTIDFKGILELVDAFDNHVKYKKDLVINKDFVSDKTFNELVKQLNIKEIPEKLNNIVKSFKFRGKELPKEVNEEITKNLMDKLRGIFYKNLKKNKQIINVNDKKVQKIEERDSDIKVTYVDGSIETIDVYLEYEAK